MNYDPASQPPVPSQNPGASSSDGPAVVAGFRMLEQLSSNTDGELWLAQHVQTGVTVGLAFLPQPYSMQRAAVPRLREELLARAQQPLRLLLVNPPIDSEFASTPEVQTGIPAKNKGGGCWIALAIVAAILVLLVPIVALLATIAVPSFLRARQRSQATKIVNDARIYEAAIDQWAIENNKVNSTPVTFHDVSDYIKASTELIDNNGHDILGNEYVIGTVADGVKVNQASYDMLSDVTRPDFWSTYAPESSSFGP